MPKCLLFINRRSNCVASPPRPLIERTSYIPATYACALSVPKIATRLIVYRFVCAVPAIVFLYRVRFLVLAGEKTVLNVLTGFLRDRPEILHGCYEKRFC